jgi:nucleoside-diphosphate-sugar epimerase
MGDRVVPRVLAGKPVQLLGNVSTEHSWAFPADVARALIAVANDNRGHGRAWHVPVNPPRTQTDVVNDIAKVAGVARVKVSSVPGAARNLVSIFNPVVRELRDTDFQFAQPFIVDDSAIRSAFGIEPTPWSDGLRDLVANY